MDPTPNGEPAASAQIKLEIIFTPSPEGPGGQLQVNGIPDNEPMGYWLLKKLEVCIDSFYASRNQPKIMAPAAQNPGLIDFLRRQRR